MPASKLAVQASVQAWRQVPDTSLNLKKPIILDMLSEVDGKGLGFDMARRDRG